MFQNFNLYENLEFEVLSESEVEIRCRMNIPYASSFGETGESDGVTLQEYTRVWNLAGEMIADHLGFDMTHEVGGGCIEFTVKARS